MTLQVSKASHLTGSKIKWHVAAGLGEAGILLALTLWTACQESLWREGEDMVPTVAVMIRIGFLFFLLHGATVLWVAKRQELLKERLRAILGFTFVVGMLVWFAFMSVGEVWLKPVYWRPLTWRAKFGAENAIMLQGADYIVAVGQLNTITAGTLARSIKGYHAQKGDGVFEITQIRNPDNIIEPVIIVPTNALAIGRQESPFWGEKIEYKMGGTKSEDSVSFSIQGDVRFGWKVKGLVGVTGHLSMPVTYPTRPSGFYSSGFVNSVDQIDSASVEILLAPADQYQSVVDGRAAVKSVVDKAGLHVALLSSYAAFLGAFWFLLGTSCRKD